MKVSEIDFIKFLPDLMQDDPDAIAIATAQTNFYKKIAEKINIMSRWGKFSDMSESELDLFAEDFYIPWYKTSDERAVKVSNLEHFVEVWSRLGTPKAIETVLEDIYGSAELIEWFSNKEDYKNGEFAVQVANFSDFTQANKDRLFRVLDIVRRYSQKIASVFTVLTTNVDWFVGVRATTLGNGISEATAAVYQLDADTRLSVYAGAWANVAKAETCLRIAE